MNIHRKNVRARAAVLVAVAALVALAGTGAVRYTSTPNFCGTCHEMSALHAGWTTGKHRETHCYDCHVDRTLSGHVMAKANGLRQVIVHFQGPVDMEKVKTDVPNHRCARCHNMSDQVRFGERVVTAHQKHSDAKLNCTVCHLSSGHTREAFAGFQDSCKECHTAKSQGADAHLKKPSCTRPDPAVL